MGKRIDGFKAALEMLQGLDLATQQSILADIARKDPEMAIRLKGSLTTFDDLRYLTAQMMLKLWPRTMLTDWGLALRASSGEVKDHIMSLMSKNNRADLQELLTSKPRSLTDVMEAQGRIMAVVLEMKEKGELVLSKDKSEKYV
jgi:flagellar motor switch protein FliG